MDIDFTVRRTPYQCSKMSDGESDSDDSVEDNTEEFNVSSKVERTEFVDLTTQFAAICAQVEISEDEFQVLSDLKERILKVAQRRNPRASVITLLRHNYLGLRNAGSNQLLVYLSEAQYRPLRMIRNEVEKLFEGSQLKALPAKSLLDVEAGYPFMDVKSGLRVGIVTHSDHQAEVVTCQLAKYLLSFDPRAKSVLSLVQYWARENKITLSSKQKLRSDTSSIPDPAALEWLVLFFLGQEKVIPTLQKLRNRAKKRRDVVIEGRPEFNVSFPCDEKLVGEWKTGRIKTPSFSAPGSNQYVLDVLQLVHGFFQFCCKSDLKGKVLNTVNGEILPVLAAIEEGLIEPSLGGNKCKDKRTLEVIRQKVLALESELEREIYLTQPFLNLRFQFCMRKFETLVRPLMQNTARQLELYLDNLGRTERGAAPFAVELMTLFKCGSETGLVSELPNFYMMQLVPKTPESLFEELEMDESIEDVRPEPLDNVERVSLPEVSGTSVQGSLLQLFQELTEQAAIDDEDWEELIEMQRKLRDFFESHRFLECEIILFRNHYLKLLPMDSENGIFIFLDHSGLYTDESGVRQVMTSNLALRKRVISKIKDNFRFSEQTKSLLLATIEPEPWPEIRTEQKLSPLSVKNFYFATRCFFPEVQACCMVQYLCKFHPHVKPLMTIVFYWAKLNNIRLGEDDTTGFTVGVAPDPALLEWLVIFFLCRNGILPPPCEISGVNATEEIIFDGIDIGIKTDPKYAQEWWDRYDEIDDEQHIYNVFELAQEFFHFWSQFRFKAMMDPIIIDMKNGNYIEKDEVSKHLKNIQLLSRATGISVQDLKVLNSEPKISEGFYSSDEVVTILHPLHIKYGFAFGWKSFLLSVCPKMGSTAENLKRMLKDYMINELVDLSLEKLFKVDL